MWRRGGCAPQYGQAWSRDNIVPQKISNILRVQMTLFFAALQIHRIYARISAPFGLYVHKGYGLPGHPASIASLSPRAHFCSSSPSLPFFPFPNHMFLTSRTQCSHSRCDRFALPHAEHRFRAVTSCRAFPANCLMRFRE
jgi:hypothetical protein